MKGSVQREGGRRSRRVVRGTAFDVVVEEIKEEKRQASVSWLASSVRPVEWTPLPRELHEIVYNTLSTE